MSRIYVTGDIHGDIRRFSSKNFPEGKELTKDDYVIICGDFGLIWNYRGESKEENYKLNWLNDKPWTTLFVDGNHENFNRLNEFPMSIWHGGRVHKIRDNVIHLMRGEIFNLDGTRIFAFGGGQSHDVADGILDPNAEDFDAQYERLAYTRFSQFRIEGRSWWKEEMPSFKEYENGRHNLANIGNTVDYIISHESDVDTLVSLRFGTYCPNALSGYLSDIKRVCNYKRHYCGHLHMDTDVNMTKTTILYRNIERIK